MRTQVGARLKVLIFAFYALNGLTGQSEAKEKVEVASAWAQDMVSLDGRTADWTDLSPQYFQELEAVIGVAHDSTRLYLLWRFRDAKWARAIKAAGLKLTCQTPSDDKRTFVLTYRGGPTPEQMGPTSEKPFGGQSGSDFPGEMRPMGPASADQRLFTCYIKDRIEEKEVPVDGSEGPAAAFGVDQGMFVYEISIPLAEGGVLNYGLGAQMGDKIKLTAVWGDMKELREQSGRPGVTFGGPEGGPPGGGMPGGEMGGRMRGAPPGGNRPDMPVKQEVQLNISLLKTSD